MSLLDLLKEKPSPEHSRQNMKGLQEMPLDELERRGLTAKIKSHLLGEYICLVAHHGAKVDNQGLTVYSAAEIRHLRNMKVSKDYLKKVHMVKKMFDGVIQNNQERRR